MVETSPMKMRSESICEIFESAPRVKLSQALPIPKQLEQGPIPQSVEGKGFSYSGTALAAVAVSRIALASSAAEITRFLVAPKPSCRVETLALHPTSNTYVNRANRRVWPAFHDHLKSAFTAGKGVEGGGRG